MVDIQSTTAENRQEKEKKEQRRKVETIAAKYNGLLITVCCHDE